MKEKEIIYLIIKNIIITTNENVINKFIKLCTIYK